MEDRFENFGSKTVGYFSIDGERNYLANSSQLKYLNTPKKYSVNIDLNEGLNEFEVSQPKSGNMRTLQWIDKNREKIKASPTTGRLIEPNFVCGIGSLVLFMHAPYSRNNISWKIFAGKWKGTIYLRSEKHESLKILDEKKFRYWAQRFDQCMVSESPDQAPDTTKLVEKSKKFCCVYQHQFSNFSVLFAAQKVAVLSEEVLSDPLPLEKLRFINLRLAKPIKHRAHEYSLRRNKFLKWWARAYLTNEEEILCGFYDENGIVHQWRMYDTYHDLVEMSANAILHGYLWDPDECIKSCEKLLAKFADTVVDDCDETIYEFSKNSFQDLEIKKLKPSEENCVVPEWYKDSMSQ